MKYALLFPGQGSQEVGMLGALAAAEPRVEQTFREASAVLGWDMWRLAQEGPADELNRTERTQPALLAAGIAVFRTWRAHETRQPTALAGHSLGEYTALVAAGSISFEDALKLVELRGQLMQAAVPVGEGAMAAVIGADDAVVEKICAEYTGDGVIEPANYNAPGQVVVAGSTAAIDWLVANAKTLGARKVVKLAMSVPSHCSLLRGAADQLAVKLREVQILPPVLPVLHNLDGRPRTEPDTIRDALIEQLYRPVRWVDTVQRLHRELGCTALLECGPGKVLTGLVKRIVNLEGPGFAGSLGDLDGITKAVDAVAVTTPAPEHA
jgi:[acyl-carrier-protein] S-malonyltransferase